MGSDQNRRHKRRLMLTNFLLLVAIVPPAIAAVVLGLPIIGNVAVLSLANDLGCTVNASGSHPCYFMGQDIGGIVYDYAIGSLFAGAFNPLLFLGVLAKLPTMVVPLWIALVALLSLSRARAKDALGAV